MFRSTLCSEIQTTNSSWPSIFGPVLVDVSMALPIDRCSYHFTKPCIVSQQLWFGMDDVTFQSLVQQLDDQLQLTASLTHKHQSLRPGRTWYVLLTPMFKPWTRCGRYTTNPNGSGWVSLPFCITKSQDGWRRVQMLCYKGGPHRVSKKYANFRCQNEPSGQTEKSPNVETLPLYIAKFWSVQTCNFVSVGSRTCIVSYSHFRKVARLHSDFSLEIDHIVIPSEVLCLRPYAPQFLKYGHVPLQPLHTILQSKIIILCSCTHTDSANCN